MSPPLLLALCALSAAFYVAVPLVMKLGGGTPFLFVVLLVLAALATAAWLESRALTVDRFGLVVLLILASEVVITAAVAIALGERYGLRELAGLLLIVTGMAVVCTPAPSDAEAPPAPAAPAAAPA